MLRAARTIAIVGLSPDRTRPSHGVAKALQRFGYRMRHADGSIVPFGARAQLQPVAGPKCLS